MADSINVFTYGTLMLPEIMGTVTGRAFAWTPAIARGYARYAIEGELYPGLIPEEGAETRGVVYLGIGEATVRVLDQFEGEWYVRTSIRVETGTGEPMEADAYLLRDGERHRITRTRWDIGVFRREGVEEFLRRYAGFSRIGRR
ncbi:MAG: gamma-glutamylcyclotransferase family protein [Acidobacteriota bacterium]